ALDQLSRREIRNNEDATKALLEASFVKGGSNPAADLIASCLIGLCNKSDACFSIFSSYLSSYADDEFFHNCASSVIQGLGPERQKALVSTIIEAAVTVGHESSGPRPWMTCITDLDARKSLASQLSTSLNSGSTPTVVKAVRAALEVSRPENLPIMLTILDRA